MTLPNLFPLLEIVALVSGILFFFGTSVGKKVGRVLPAPFWVYFLSILSGSMGLLPSSAEVYNFVSLNGLSSALFLMLVGSPATSLFKLGRRALTAMCLATTSMILAGIGSYLLLFRYFSGEEWKAVGVLMGTWVGGSANMIAVKEIIGMSDGAMAPLVIVDTLLSYSWLALLFLGVGFQSKFDSRAKGSIEDMQEHPPSSSESLSLYNRTIRTGAVLIIGFFMAWIMTFMGGGLIQIFPFLSRSAWTLLLASTLGITFAFTRLNRLEAWGASRSGTFLLYMVLVVIGAKTNIEAAGAAPKFLVFGALMLSLHGIILFSLGRVFKIHLYLLSTASQANVGGPASAPIVATAYRPGTAHIGVLMAVGGALFGTYVGLLGAIVCRQLDAWLR